MIAGLYGAKAAIVALAKKAICTLSNLIVDREMVEAEDSNKFV